MRLWQDGFEIASAATQAARRYAFVSGGGSTTPGRTQGLALTSNFGVTRVTPSLGTPQATLITGWGMRVNANVGDTSTEGFYWEKGLTEQVHIHFRTEATFYEIDVYRAGTLLGSTTEQFSYGTWSYFEISITFDPAVGAVELRHNEQTVLNLSGINTANEGTAGADIFAIRWPGNDGTNFAWDDLYINDTSGSKNNTFNGDTFIVGALPNGDGFHLDWGVANGSTHYFMVDDPGSSNPQDSNNYVFSDVVGDKDSFEFQDLVGITGTIQAVLVDVQAAMAAAGSRTLQPFFRTAGGTEANGANMVVSSLNYASFIQIFEDNPVTATTWSITDLDDGQWGVEVTV